MPAVNSTAQKRAATSTRSRTASRTLPESGFVREAQLIPTFVPVSRATLWRMVKAGTFPAPVKLSMRVTAWRVEDVHAWIQTRTAKA